MRRLWLMPDERIRKYDFLRNIHCVVYCNMEVVWFVCVYFILLLETITHLFDVCVNCNSAHTCSGTVEEKLASGSIWCSTALSSWNWHNYTSYRQIICRHNWIKQLMWLITDPAEKQKINVGKEHRYCDEHQDQASFKKLWGNPRAAHTVCIHCFSLL